MTRVHAFTDDALGDHDATGLVESLHAGEVSVPEVVDAAIARAERIDPELGAIVYRAFDRARGAARNPRPGYFAGVPTFIKDNCDVEGIPTRDGGDCIDPPPAKRDGDLAKMLLATGLIPLGKTQMSEFGFSASAEHPRLGPVRNPWSPEHTAGASSSGSAAMVAAGVVPIAHANDGGGSIRIPASVNGLVGLKPTRDRFAQDSLFRQMPLRIVQDGVLTRSVRDQAAYLRETERVYRNVSLPPIGDVTGPVRKRLKVACAATALGRPVDPAVSDATQKTIRLLEELGHSVEEIDVPVADSFGEDFVLYWGTLAFTVTRTGRLKYGRGWRPDRTDNLTRGLADHCRRNARRVPGAIRRLRRASAESVAALSSYDVLLSPTLALPTPRLGHLDPTQDYETVIERLQDWVTFTPLQNATGEPSISLPLATDGEDLPLGMMFSAGAGRERLLLELAYELESAVGWDRIQDRA